MEARRQDRRASSKLKGMPPVDRILLQLPRIGLATDGQLEHLADVYENGGAKAIQAMLNLMDSGVEDCVTWSPGAGQADFIGSVTGRDGDKMDLIEPVPMPPTAGCTLMHSEGTLEVVLSQLTYSVAKTVADTLALNKPTEDLAVEVSRQVCVLVQRIQFSKEVEKYVNEGRDLKSLLKTFDDTYAKMCSRLIQKEIGEGELATLRALQTVMYEQRLILEKLKSQKTAEDVIAVWKDQIRFFRDIENEEAITKMKSSDRVVTCGTEYDPPQLLITTEFTHNLRWAYLDTMAEGGLRMLTLVGETGSGKTAMLRDIGQLIGTHPTVIRASEDMPSNISYWRRKFNAAQGATQLAPVIISQAQRLSEKTLDVAIEVARSLNIALCLTMIPGPAATALQEGLLAGECTTMRMPPADLPVIAAGQLARQGLEKYDSLGAPLAAILETMAKECTKQSHYDFGPRTLDQICTQIGAGHSKTTAEEETVKDVVRRCLCPRLVREDVAVLQRLMGAHFKDDRPLVAPSAAKEGRWQCVVDNILSITKVEPDCMVLPVPPSDEEEFFKHFSITLNKGGHTLVDGLDGKTLEQLSPEELLGAMPRKGEPGKDGILVQALRKAMDDHPMEMLSPTLVWIKIMTGKCSAAKWESMFELLNDSGCLNIATGEQIRLAPNLRYLFVLPDAGDTSADTFSRSAVVWTDPDK